MSEPQNVAAEPQRRYCPTCGGKLTERGQYCPGCGASTHGANAFCPSCGTNLQEPELGDYCPSCGCGGNNTSQQGQRQEQVSAANVAASVNEFAKKAQSFASQAAKKAGVAFKNASENGITIKTDLPLLSASAGCAISTIALFMPWSIIEWSSLVELGMSAIGYDSSGRFSIMSFADLAAKISGYGGFEDVGVAILASSLLVLGMIAAIVCMAVGLSKVWKDRAKSSFLWIPTIIIAVLTVIWIFSFGVGVGDYEGYAIGGGLTPAPFVAILACGTAAFLPNWLLKNKSAA